MVVPPISTPKWSFLVGKPMGLLGKPTILVNETTNYERNPFVACWSKFRGVLQFGVLKQP